MTETRVVKQPTTTTTTTTTSAAENGDLVSCSGSPCFSTMLPPKTWSEKSHDVKDDNDYIILNRFNSDPTNFYKSYNVWTGINIAASLGGFFMLLILMLVYKSKCKWKKSYPPCPSVEDGEETQQEPWDPFINHLEMQSHGPVSRNETMSQNASEKSLADSVTGWRESQCLVHTYSGSSRPFSGSSRTLPSRLRMSAGSSGDSSHQLDMMVHRVGSGCRRPPRFAISFDEQAASIENWWQRVDINVIQPTPSDAASNSFISDSAPATMSSNSKRNEFQTGPTISVIPTSPAIESRDFTFDSLNMLDAESPAGSFSPRKRLACRRSMFSRQSGVCIDDDMLPECIGDNKTDLAGYDCLSVDHADVGNQNVTNTQSMHTFNSDRFLNVPGAHTQRSTSPPKKSPNFLAPPPLNFGPGRPTSPPPVPSLERTCIDLTSPSSPMDPSVQFCQCSSRRTLSPRSSLKRTPKLSQLQYSNSMTNSRHWSSTDSMSRVGGTSIRKKRVNFSSFDAQGLNQLRPNRSHMGSSISLKAHFFGSRDESSKSKAYKIRKQQSFSLQTLPIPSIEIHGPTSEPADNSPGVREFL